MGRKQLPKKMRVPGLYLYCNSCKRYYAHDKKVKCTCKLVYRAKIHIAHTKRSARIVTLKSERLNDAIRELIEHKEFFRNNSYQRVELPSTEVRPVRLIECLDAYRRYLKNEGVPMHKVKPRSIEHIKDFERWSRYFVEALIRKGIDASIIKFLEISDHHVGFLYEYITEVKDFSPKSFNNFFAMMNSFAEYIKKRYYHNFINPFDEVKRQEVILNPTSITQDEFEALLAVIKPNLSNKVHTSHYRPWLKDGFRLALLTGGRREEVAELKWSGIVYDKSGEPELIEVNHFKINRAGGNYSDKNAKLKPFLVSEELKELLYELGYEKYKNTDRHILAPEESLSRKGIMDFLTDSFTYFYKLLGTGEVKTFKCLRKTYATGAYRQFGENAIALTNHSNTNTLTKHYLDKKAISKEQRSFKVFGNKKE